MNNDAVVVRFTQISASDDSVEISSSLNGTDIAVFSVPLNRCLQVDISRHIKNCSASAFVSEVASQAAREAISSYGAFLLSLIPQRICSTFKQWGSVSSILIIGEEAIQSICWEALPAPDVETPLSISVPIVRSRRLGASKLAARQYKNVLFVTSRPLGMQDIERHQVFLSYWQAVLSAPINTVMVRPGTYDAIELCLKTHGPGFFDIAHFDVHGTILSQSELIEHEATGKINRTIKFCAGDRSKSENDGPFLVLEGTCHDSGFDIVSPMELYHLLHAYKIDSVSLNACESAKSSDITGSFIERLNCYGVSDVVGIGHKVTPTSARIFVAAFYHALSMGSDFANATRHARCELFEGKQNKQNGLEVAKEYDWIGPVVFSSHPPIPPKRISRSTAPFARNTTLAGREVDIINIETSVLKGDSFIILRGLRGTGKTALLRSLGQWWCATGFVKEAIEVNIAETGWDPESWQKLIDAPPPQNYNTPTSYRRKMFYIADAKDIRSPSLESLEPTSAQHPHCAALKEILLASARQGDIFFVESCRTDAPLFIPEPFTHTFTIAPLDPSASRQVATATLTGMGRRELIAHPLFSECLAAADGIPSLIHLLMRTLAQTSANTFAEIIGAIDPHREGETSDYAHLVEGLNHDLKEMLICAAAFVKYMFIRSMGKYSEQVAAIVGRPSYGHVMWDELLTLLECMGYVIPDIGSKIYVQLHPVISLITRNIVSDVEFINEKNAAEIVFVMFCREMASSLSEGKISAKVGRAVHDSMMQLERGNLRRAIGISIQNGHDFQNMAQVYISSIGRGARECIVALDSIIADTVGLEAVVNLDSLAILYSEISDALLAELNAGRASQFIDYAISVIDGISNGERCILQIYKSVLLICRANILSSQLKESHACQAEAEALKIWDDVSDSPFPDWLMEKRRLAKPRQPVEQEGQATDILSLNELGIALGENHQYERALEVHFRCASIARMSGDKYNFATELHNIGRCMHALGRLDEADKHFQSAMIIFAALGNDFGIGIAHHHIGHISSDLGHYSLSEEHLLKAKEIMQRTGYLEGVAKTLIHLGITHSKMGMIDAAIDDYKSAISITDEFSVATEEGAAARHNLAAILVDSGNIVRELEGLHMLHDSLKIFDELGDTHGRGRVLNHLGIVYFRRSAKALGVRCLQSAIVAFLDVGDHVHANIAMENLRSFIK